MSGPTRSFSLLLLIGLVATGNVAAQGGDFALGPEARPAGLRLEEMLLAEGANPGLWPRFEEEATVRTSVFLKGAFTGFYLPEAAFEELLAEVGEENIARSLYPTGFEAHLDEAQARSLLNREEVLYLDVSVRLRAAIDDVVEIIDAESVWQMQLRGTPITGTGQTVAVIDTGIWFGHPDLAGKDVVGNILNCHSGGLCFQDPTIEDEHGHGTRMAGIIAANGGVTGVAPGADLIALKIFPDALGDGFFTMELTQAILWCVEHADEYNITVMNMSIATDDVYTEVCDSGALKGAISLAANLNIAMAAGTGNTGSTTGIGLPACLPNIIPVAAAKKDDHVWRNSNYNDLVKIFATGGEAVKSLCIGGGYCFTGGTSAATAATSGSLALLQHFLELGGKPKSLPSTALEELLHDTGDPIVNLPSQWKRINVGNAVRSYIVEYRRGDANLDETLDISDPILVFDYLFGDLGTLTCEDAADANDDSGIDLSDVTFLLSYLFGTGVQPPGPFSLPGPDPTEDPLNCFDL